MLAVVLETRYPRFVWRLLLKTRSETAPEDVLSLSYTWSSHKKERQNGVFERTHSDFGLWYPIDGVQPHFQVVPRFLNDLLCFCQAWCRLSSVSQCPRAVSGIRLSSRYCSGFVHSSSLHWARWRKVENIGRKIQLLFTGRDHLQSSCRHCPLSRVYPANLRNSQTSLIFVTQESLRLQGTWGLTSVARLNQLPPEENRQQEGQPFTVDTYWTGTHNLLPSYSNEMYRKLVSFLCGENYLPGRKIYMDTGISMTVHDC